MFHTTNQLNYMNQLKLKVNQNYLNRKTIEVNAGFISNEAK